VRFALDALRLIRLASFDAASERAACSGLIGKPDARREVLFAGHISGSDRSSLGGLNVL
jgi:hypothetical protein